MHLRTVQWHSTKVCNMTKCPSQMGQGPTALSPWRSWSHWRKTILSLVSLCYNNYNNCQWNSCCMSSSRHSYNEPTLSAGPFNWKSWLVNNFWQNKHVFELNRQQACQVTNLWFGHFVQDHAIICHHEPVVLKRPMWRVCCGLDKMNVSETGMDLGVWAWYGWWYACTGYWYGSSPNPQIQAMTLTNAHHDWF